MGILSFLSKKPEYKCNWCGDPIDEPAYSKRAGKKFFYFCSSSCKTSFRKGGFGKGGYKRCSTCAMSPKSWD